MKLEKVRFSDSILVRQFDSRANYDFQHSQSLEAWYYHTPGLKVVMPSTAYDAK